MRGDTEAGFTLIETLVVMSLLSVTALGLYAVMFSGSRSADTAQNVATISQEARLGLNRMIRDTREGALLSGFSTTSYTVEADFDGDGSIDAASFERVTYAFDVPGRRITISNGIGTPETLVGGVEQISGKPVFSYSSNRLEYDTNNDGTTTIEELDAAQVAGAALTTDKTFYVSSISYAVKIVSGNRSSEFYTQAQLRNKR